jgi:hypothetical protein
MTFDQQLTRAFETLTERLRGDIDRQVQGVLDELMATARDRRDGPATPVHAATDAMEVVVAAAREEAHEEGRAAGKAEGRREALEDGRREGADEAALTRLANGVRSIEGARSLSEILDTLVRCACQETARAGVWLIRGGRLRHWRSTGFDGADADQSLAGEGAAMAEAVRTNGAVSREGTLAVPIALGGQVVAVLFADQGPANSTAPIGNPTSIDVLTRYAARCLEALTAFKAARALTERPGTPGVLDETAPAAGEDASADDSASALRYARLLVSEIKLYHEAAVIEGRRDRDLATRLGGEIARARVMYEQRVPAHVRQRADYFHEELVRTLANGDPGLLELQ